MKKQLLLLLIFLSSVTAYAQRTVTGVVTSEEDKMPIIGASVMVQGTKQGVMTDVDGKYSIKVNDNASLIFRFLGMKEKIVKVAKQAQINVNLMPSSVQIEEVVVTAMGVRSEKKKLNFAVQSLSASEITAGQSANFVSSLQGKIAGVQTSSSGGSPNARTNIIIRAVSSINPSQNNEPLFIIDGMAVSGGGSSAGDINPNDIESLTVLKGAAASALYGQEAANGVIMITTKTGKSGKISVNASSTVQFENAVRVPKIQRKYIPGSQGFTKDLTVGGWGPLLANGEQIYDNVGNFLGTGLFQKYDVSASGGTDKFTSYASINCVKSDGIVKNDFNNKLGLFLKAKYDISKQISLSFQSNYTQTKSRAFGNSMSNIYLWPINNDMRDYKQQDGTIKWLYDITKLSDDEKLLVPMNPYWGINEDSSIKETTRNILQGSIDWKPIKGLILTGKISYDKSHASTESCLTPRFSSSDFANPSILNSKKYLLGKMTYSPDDYSMFTAQALATYSLSLTKDINANFLLGVETKEQKTKEANMGGVDFVLPGSENYHMQNIRTVSTDLQDDYATSLYHTRSNKFGYYGEVRLDYRGIAHISGTARVDMSSTLNKKSYNYESITGGLVFSELFHLTNDVFSYGKLRGNYAQVGKEGPLYSFDRGFKQWSNFPDGGFGIDAAVATSNNLLPEMTSSWEIGTDLRFFNEHTRLDIAYYSTTNSDQIVRVRVSPASGTILQVRNEGSIRNYGIEAQLAQDIITNKDLKWTAVANFSLNRGKVTSLPDGMTEIQGTQYGDLFPTAFLNGSTIAISGKDYERAPNGKIICDSEGKPVISKVKGSLIGDRSPDFLLGITNTFQWRDLSCSFLFDMRKGGDVANLTARSLISSGQHKSLENYRNREVLVDGVVKQADGTYLPNTKPILFDQKTMNDYYTSVSSNFIEDGSYIRLSYVTLGYDLSRYFKKTAIKGLKVSATGRNLFLLTKYSGVDPQLSVGSANGTGSNGIDNFAIPNTRAFNFTINATF